jgi:hypothetical protein
MKTRDILILGMAGAILLLCGHYYFERQSDWDEVQKTAIRVDSGLRHESLVALRSKVADLDAALTHYVDGSRGRSKESRVLAIRQAIESVEWAINHQDSTSQILDGTSDFAFYEKRQYLTAPSDCAESSGKLFVEGAVLAQASLAYAEDALTKPYQSPALRTVDLNTLRANCKSKYDEFTNQNAVAAAMKEKARKTRELEHQRKWRSTVAERGECEQHPEDEYCRSN